MSSGYPKICKCGREYKIIEQRHSWRNDDDEYRCECGEVIARWGGGLSCSIFLVDDTPKQAESEDK